MKRLSQFRFSDLLAAINRSTASSSSPTPATNETGDLQKQLADAQKQAQNALGEWRRYPNAYYELAWVEATEKVRRLEARLPKRQATSGG
jgi:hypothetical protein